MNTFNLIGCVNTSLQINTSRPNLSILPFNLHSISGIQPFPIQIDNIFWCAMCLATKVTELNRSFFSVSITVLWALVKTLLLVIFVPDPLLRPIRTALFYPKIIAECHTWRLCVSTDGNAIHITKDERELWNKGVTHCVQTYTLYAISFVDVCWQLCWDKQGKASQTVYSADMYVWLTVAPTIDMDCLGVDYM